MHITINKRVMSIVHGDITDEDVDAVVNAANNHLWMGGGVAGAIKRKGGEDIEREAVEQGPIEIGGSVITSGGHLRARHVIHAAVMGQDLHTDAKKITDAIHSALTLAGKQRLTTISFPALGTGVGGFSPHHCARIMITEAIGTLLTETPIREIRVVLFDQATFDVFEEELKQQFSAKRH